MSGKAKSAAIKTSKNIPIMNRRTSSLRVKLLNPWTVIVSFSDSCWREEELAIRRELPVPHAFALGHEDHVDGFFHRADLAQHLNQVQSGKGVVGLCLFELRLG